MSGPNASKRFLMEEYKWQKNGFWNEVDKIFKYAHLQDDQASPRVQQSQDCQAFFRGMEIPTCQQVPFEFEWPRCRLWFALKIATHWCYEVKTAKSCAWNKIIKMTKHLFWNEVVEIISEDNRASPVARWIQDLQAFPMKWRCQDDKK